MMSRMILSANATLLEGGQGLNLHHMIVGSGEAFDLSVFCRGMCPGVETQVVPESTASRLIGRVPFLRRLRDWRNCFADEHFDGYVARRIAKAKVFQGVTGQCLQSLKAASEHGCRTLLDVVTT